jgi:O-Antigen ligase
VSSDLLPGVALTAVLVLIAFLASGGDDLAPNTWVEIGLVVIGAAVAIAGVVAGRRGPRWGGVAIALFAAMAALSYLSIAWSVQPATSWVESNRTLSYLAAFGAAAALARLAPGRWRAVVGGVAAASVLISAYALLAKVFPGTLDPGDPLGRLRLPFGYWNAVGLAAAMGIAPCVWLGARQEASTAVRALAVAAITILVPALLLSYSRSALAVAVIGTGCWFALVPLRLRGALVLGLGAVGGGVISAWALATHSIYADGVSLSDRISAGHSFGLVILAVLIVTTAVGFVAAYASDRVALPDSTRQRLGTALVCLLALIPIGGVVALAASSRGLTGEVSHLWTRLTNSNGGNLVGDQPGRLIELSNSRPTYWREGLKVGEHHLLSGVGARGFQTAQLRYSNSTWTVDAHSYAVETFADFGLIGVAVSLALLVAWVRAANRALVLRWPRARDLRGPPAPPSSSEAERIGLLTLFAVVLTFGLHSLVDWTWFIPGNAVVALVCAGWLAGRGPVQDAPAPAGRRRRLSRSPGAALLVTAIAALTAIAVFAIVSPLRSYDSTQSSIAALVDRDTGAAITDAQRAASADPESINPLLLLATIYSGEGNRVAARAQLVKAATTQPQNPETWEQLGCFDLYHAPGAVDELRRAYGLEPWLLRRYPGYGPLCAALGSASL